MAVDYSLAAIMDSISGDTLVQALIYILVILIGIIIIVLISDYFRRKSNKRIKEMQEAKIAKTETVPEPIKTPTIAPTTEILAPTIPTNNIKTEIKSDSSMITQTKVISTMEAKSVKAVLCPVCNGRGEVFRLPKDLAAKVQLGDKSDYASQYVWQPCPACDAKGYILVPES